MACMTIGNGKLLFSSPLPPPHNSQFLSCIGIIIDCHDVTQLYNSLMTEVRPGTPDPLLSIFCICRSYGAGRRVKPHVALIRISFQNYRLDNVGDKLSVRIRMQRVSAGYCFRTAEGIEKILIRKLVDCVMGNQMPFGLHFYVYQ